MKKYHTIDAGAFRRKSSEHAADAIERDGDGEMERRPITQRSAATRGKEHTRTCIRATASGVTIRFAFRIPVSRAHSSAAGNPLVARAIGVRAVTSDTRQSERSNGDTHSIDGVIVSSVAR